MFNFIRGVYLLTLTHHLMQFEKFLLRNAAKTNNFKKSKIKYCDFIDIVTDV